MINISEDPAINGFRIFTDKTEFRILQLTDLHYWHLGIMDRYEMTRIRDDLCEQFDVDFIVNTGDMFCRSIYFMIKRIMRGFDKIIGKCAPWTFAWGNHDLENFKKDNWFGTFDDTESYLKNLKNCYYRPTRRYIEDYECKDAQRPDFEDDAVTKPKNGEISSNKFDGFYGGNFQFLLMNPKTNKPAWQFFILNTRRWYSVPWKALCWMKDATATFDNKIPAIAFYHVPNKEYKTIWDKDIAVGFKRENVCYEKDHGLLHETFKQMGNVKAAFTGHDHVNDYFGTYEGIEYVYGRKSGTGGYGSTNKQVKVTKPNQKKVRVGGKLIKIDLSREDPLNNGLEHYSIFYDGSVWKPTEKVL